LDADNIERKASDIIANLRSDRLLFGLVIAANELGIGQLRIVASKELDSMMSSAKSPRQICDRFGKSYFDDGTLAEVKLENCWRDEYDLPTLPAVADVVNVKNQEHSASQVKIKIDLPVSNNNPTETGSEAQMESKALLSSSSSLLKASDERIEVSAATTVPIAVVAAAVPRPPFHQQLPMYLGVYTPDDLAERCDGCKDTFDKNNTKHHCRHCGKFFFSSAFSGFFLPAVLSWWAWSC